jgi:hypothetical protein
MFARLLKPLSLAALVVLCGSLLAQPASAQSIPYGPYGYSPGSYDYTPTPTYTSNTWTVYSANTSVVPYGSHGYSPGSYDYSPRGITYSTYYAPRYTYTSRVIPYGSHGYTPGTYSDNISAYGR